MLVVALCLHAVTTVTALWIVGTATLAISLKSVLAVVVAAALLPGIATLATSRRERFARVALVLVVVIGAAIVEVVASAAELRASVLLGAAMLEFAVLFSLDRRDPARERSERAQR